MRSRVWWLVAALVVVVACLPVPHCGSGGAGSHDGAGDHRGPAGLVSHHELHAAQGKHPGFGVALEHVVVDHPHAVALREAVCQGIDGMAAAAVRSVSALRLLTAVAGMVAAAAVVFVAVVGLHRLRGPPGGGAWFGPVRPGRIVLADLCVIRR